jgi:hypothetical protein
MGQIMQAAYLSYYFLLLDPLLVFVRRSRWFAGERYTFAVMTTYLCCFIVYLLYPVLGPRALAAGPAGRLRCSRPSRSMKIQYRSASITPKWDCIHTVL